MLSNFKLLSIINRKKNTTFLAGDLMTTDGP